MATIASNFLQILRALYEKRLELEKTASISNWTTQSVANRILPYPVKMVAKMGNKTVIVQLAAGWQPARQGAGYNGEDVKTSKMYASNIWSMYAAQDVPQADKEVFAVLGYFLSHILTGQPASYENSGKIEFLGVILAGLSDLTSFSFEMKMSDTETVKYDKNSLIALVNGLKPVSGRFLSNLKTEGKAGKHARLDLSDNVDKKAPVTKSRKPKVTNKTVKVDNPPVEV